MFFGIIKELQFTIRNLLWHIIKPQERYTLTRDEIQPEGADDMHRTSRGDDMPSLRLG